MGTNALDLALRTGRGVSVFAAEHLNRLFHGWSCWAQPIRNVSDARPAGVVDISAPWDADSPSSGALASSVALLVEQMTRSEPKPDFGYRIATKSGGPPRVEVNGAVLALPRRQVEVLAVLVLKGSPLSFEEIRADVCGDVDIGAVTLREEWSVLRTIVGSGILTTRPCRVVAEIESDIGRTLNHAEAGKIDRALEAHNRPISPITESPWLIRLREHVETPPRKPLSPPRSR
ncbi:hypothetical protein ACWPOB_01865 [Rhodococcus sp. 2H158]